MIVMKFGGSSVADAERIRRVGTIVRSQAARKPLVVVSAMRGATDELLALGRDALAGREDRLEALRERHEKVMRGLEADPGLLKRLFDELGVLCKGISLVKELTPRTLDYIASFGERLNARIVAAHLGGAAVDAFEAGLVTDDVFGGANPLPEAADGIRAFFGGRKGLDVVTGYVGRTRGGDITTLGRNGSDYTASILGAALGAEEIQIWSDTDGVMTADPAAVPDARPVARMTFDEAGELAWYGGKVLHPHTIVPAMEKGIPVRVLNTFQPDHPGTTVVARDDGHAKGLKSIVCRRHVTAVNVTTPRMLLQSGYLSRIFEIFAKHRISINMVATSEVSVSVTLDDARNLEAAAQELGQIAKVEIEPDRAMVCVVGEGLKETPGIAGDVFGALKEAGVNVRMISQGASEINLAFVVADRDCARAVKALHARLFR